MNLFVTSCQCTTPLWICGGALSLTITALGHLPHEICSLETMVLISNKYGLGQSQAITHSHINFPLAIRLVITLLGLEAPPPENLLGVRDVKPTF
jgi:hypothetical protein